MLPKVRREANDWRETSQQYLISRDSARAADLHHVASLADTKAQLGLKDVLIASREADTKIWKQRARRRGLVNWLLTLGAAAVTYLAISK